MKNKGRVWGRLIWGFGILIVCVVGILINYNQANHKSMIEQIDNYIYELSEKTTLHVRDILQNKQSSIASIAFLYGESIKTTEPDVRLLSELEKTSGFDWIRFVDKYGTDYTADGDKVNVVGRDYFEKGITGKSGLSYVKNSRVNGEVLVGFYSPVYFDDEICGIMIGFLEEDTVAKILATYMYDYSVDTMIVTSGKQIIGKSMEESEKTIDVLDDVLETVKRDDRAVVLKAVESHEEARYFYEDETRESVGYVKPIEGTDWNIIQLFPPEASNKMKIAAAEDEHRTLFLFAVVFVVFGAAVVLIYLKEKKLETERRSKNKIATLIQSVSDEYLCLIDVNLKTGKEELFRINEGVNLRDWAEGNYYYSHCIEMYAKKIVAPKDRSRYLSSVNLPYLRNVFAQQREFYFEYDAIMEGQVKRFQDKYTLIKGEGSDDHILLSIRDITKIACERVREKTSKDLIVSAASRVYPLIVEQNLTKDAVNVIYKSDIICGSISGRMSCREFNEKLKEIFPNEDEYYSVIERSSREALLEAFEEESSEITIIAHGLNARGEIKEVEIKNILMQNEDGDVNCIFMARRIEDNTKE